MIIACCFINQRQQAIPLGSTGVLELVKQPVVDAGIEAEIDGLAAQPGLFVLGPLPHE